MPTTAYRPTDAQIAEFWARLGWIAEHFVERIAVDASPELAAAVAACFTGDPGPAGTWAIRARCDLDGAGTPDPSSLWLAVYVRPHGQWEPLAECRGHVLMPPEWVAWQCRTLALAVGYGIPDSPAALFGG
jgi:hypothetical protein